MKLRLLDKDNEEPLYESNTPPPQPEALSHPVEIEADTIKEKNTTDLAHDDFTVQHEDAFLHQVGASSSKPREYTTDLLDSFGNDRDAMLKHFDGHDVTNKNGTDNVQSTFAVEYYQF